MSKASMINPIDIDVAFILLTLFFSFYYMFNTTFTFLENKTRYIGSKILYLPLLIKNLFLKLTAVYSQKLQTVGYNGASIVLTYLFMFAK